MPITTLFLDVVGVLLTNGGDYHVRRRAEMEERHGLTFEIHEEDKLTFEEYMCEQSKPYRAMIALFSQLKIQHGLRIAVVSNEAREVNEYWIRKFKLNRFVDSFISSCFVHLRKPDANTPMFVQIAEGLGIRSVLHTDYKSTCAKLASFGLQHD